MKGKLLILGLLASLISCESNENNTGEKKDTLSTEQTQSVNASVKSIVFFGNSLTAAYQLSPEQGFPALIQQKIDSLGLPYKCVNAGLSGETTADGVNRIDWVLQQPMDVFVLELGPNDALRGLPLDESIKNLQMIIDRVKAARPECKLVIAGMLAPPNLGAHYTNAFRDMYPELAKKNGAKLVPFLLENVAGIRELNLEDGIHPNVEGQKIVAENVWTVLKEVL
ncbi:MAG: arylesterase [Lewinellaceae bacterium]|nr:arylesterase [Saprospiraceae bacterium]MCB9344955.1 arylesterase [Lewinellaceae bacterium]